MEITNKKEMKQWIKTEAISIREARENMKTKQRETGDAWAEQSNLVSRVQEYRTRHIAYSLAKGKTYKQIENKVKEGNEPNWNRIDSILVHELAYVLFDKSYAKPIYLEEAV